MQNIKSFFGIVLIVTACCTTGCGRTRQTFVDVGGGLPPPVGGGYAEVGNTTVAGIMMAQFAPGPGVTGGGIGGGTGGGTRVEPESVTGPVEKPAPAPVEEDPAARIREATKVVTGTTVDKPKVLASATELSDKGKTGPAKIGNSVSRAVGKL